MTRGRTRARACAAGTRPQATVQRREVLLDSIGAAYPRDASERRIAHARRLYLLNEIGRLMLAGVPQQLSLSEIASIAMVRDSQLRNDPEVRPLPDELAPVREKFPPHAKEPRLTYAKRLFDASSRGLVEVGGVRRVLTAEELSAISKAPAGHLRAWPGLAQLPPRLAAVRQSHARRPAESAAAYARRLHELGAKGALRIGSERRRLTLDELSQVAGIAASPLRMCLADREVPQYLQPVLEAHPRREGEFNQPYARRLAALSRGGCVLVGGEVRHLTVEEIAALSGAMPFNLRRDPAFDVVPEHLAAVKAMFPKEDVEHGRDYARRLSWLGRDGELVVRGQARQLGPAELSLLCGLPEADLRRDRGLVPLPAPLEHIRRDCPRRPNEERIAYARRLFRRFPRLTITKLALLTGIPETSLSRAQVLAGLAVQPSFGAQGGHSLQR